MPFATPFSAPFRRAGGEPDLVAHTRAMARLRLYALTFITFILFSQIGPDPFADQSVSLVRSSGDLIKQAVLILLCALLLFEGWDSQILRANLALPVSLLILLGYCLLSVAWAIDPAISIRRLGLTALTMWFMYRAVGLLGYAFTLESLRIALVVILVVNFAMVLLSEHGIHHLEVGDNDSVVGAWRGILSHKNIAGPISAVTVIVFLFDWRDRDKLLRYLVVALAAVFLAFTQSKTAMFALAVAVAAGVVLPVLAARSRSFRVFALVLLVVGALQVFSIFAGDFITSLDDPTAFTGRASIWRVLVEYAQTHLWTGAGFGSFWQIGNASPVWDYDTGWVARQAAGGHNAYLDLLVTIGLPGLLLTVVTMFLLPTARLWLSNDMAQSKRGLILALIFFVIVNNLAESQLLDRTSFDQEILVMALAFIADDGIVASVQKRLKAWFAAIRQGVSA